MLDNLFLSVGAIKAGTTWLFSQLADHPDIFFSREKEIHYFAHMHLPDKPLSRETRARRFKDFAASVNEKGNIDITRRIVLWYGNYLDEPVNDRWYINLFCFRGRQKYCADFSNLYALLPPEGWDHVHKVARNVRVIYTMRDPLKRLWSHTRFHMQFIGKVDQLSNWSRSDYQAFLKLPHVEAHTHYADIISRMRSSLNEDELRVYFFESFRGRPVDMLRDVENFLGVRNKVFAQDKLDQKVNAAVEVPMPEFFADLCRPILDREYEKLAKLGLTIPPDWST